MIDTPSEDPYEISLHSHGIHMIFGGIDESSSYDACEFIIKSNIIREAPITLIINSEGGSVSDGFAVVDVMESSRLPVHTVGTGMVASMALLILSAGAPGFRTLTKNSEIMAHQYSAGTSGKHHELMAVVEEQKRLEELFVEHFLRHTKMSKAKIKDILFGTSDRWLSPAECKKFGLCDHVTDFMDVKPKVRKKTAK